MSNLDWIKRGVEAKAQEKEDREKNRPIVLTRLPIGCDLIAEMQTAISTVMNLIVIDSDDESLVDRLVVFSSNTPIVSKNRELLSSLLPGDRIRIIPRKHSRLAPLSEIHLELYERHLSENQRLTVFTGRKASVAHENMWFFLEGVFEKLYLLNHENPRKPHSRVYRKSLIDQIEDAKTHVMNLQKKSYKLSKETLSLRGLVEEDQYYS